MPLGNLRVRVLVAMLNICRDNDRPAKLNRRHVEAPPAQKTSAHVIKFNMDDKKMKLESKKHHRKYEMDDDPSPTRHRSHDHYEDAVVQSGSEEEGYYGGDHRGGKMADIYERW